MMRYDLKPVDLAAMVKPVVDDASLVAAGKEITLTFVASDIPPAFIDPHRSIEIFGNLISNALKYTRMEERSRCGWARVLSVCRWLYATPDPASRKRNFRIFHKILPDQYRDKGGKRGTGIGLAFVKALVEGREEESMQTAR